MDSNPSGPALEDAATFEWRPFRAKHRREHDGKAHAELDESFHEHQPHDRAADNRPDLIECADRFGPALDLLRDAEVFGFDTEFIGEETYYPKICLVQAATDERVEVIDALADFELNQFWELVADPSLRKIVHAGAQDLEPVVRLLGKPPANVIDTQVVAAFAGFKYPSSLAVLAEQLVGASLGKGLKFSNWDRRPLSEVQLTYAANDVRYLVALAEALDLRLDELGNRELAYAACEELCRAELYVVDPLERKVKAKGVGSMGRRKRSALNALLLWREALARQLDAPPRSVVPRPGARRHCRPSPDRRRRTQEDQGTAPADPLPLRRQALRDRRPSPGQPHGRQDQTDPQDRRRPRRGSGGVGRHRTALTPERSIDPSVVTSKKELMTLRLSWRKRKDRGQISEDPPARLTQGWRSELVNGQLDRLR